MRCEALIEREYEGKTYEDTCRDTNTEVCDMCGKYLCNKHSKEMDGDSAKHHFHTICWESRIFQMFKRKKDIPKTFVGICARCISQGDRNYLRVELFQVGNNLYPSVCGLCKSELLDKERHYFSSVQQENK